MNRFRKFYLTACFTSAMSFVSIIPLGTVGAQTPATPTPQADNSSNSDDGFHVAITPYLWFAGLHGTTGVLGHDASVHVSAVTYFLTSTLAQWALSNFVTTVSSFLST